MSKEGQCGVLCGGGAWWYGLIYNGGGSLINLPRFHTKSCLYELYNYVSVQYPFSDSLVRMCLNGSLSALPLQVYRRAKAAGGRSFCYLFVFFLCANSILYTILSIHEMYPSRRS